jgi:PAS domain S-box-containing protein
MNIISLIVFFCFFVYLFLGIHVYRSDRRSLLNKLFLAISLSAGIWAFAYTFMLSAPDAETALFWRRISVIGWTTIYSFLLHFFLELTKRKKFFQQIFTIPLIYLPILIFLPVFVSGSWNVTDAIAKTGLGWVYINPPSQIWNWAFIVYYTAILITVIVLTIEWGYKSGLQRHKKQSRIIAITLIIAFILGSVTDGFLPAYRIADIPPLAIVFIMIPMAGVWYSIARYRLIPMQSQTFALDIIQNISEGVILVSSEGLIKLANESALKILGHATDELINKPLSFIMNGNLFSFPLPAKVMNKNLNLHNKVMTIKARNKEIIPVLFSGKIMPDQWGDTLGLVCTFQDISDRLHAKEALDKEKAYFEQLFNSAPVGIVLLDNDDRIIDCNSEFTRLFQFTKEEAGSRFINDLIVPEHLKQEASEISGNIASGGTVYRETTRQRKDDTPVEVAITGKPVIVKSGQVAIYGIYQDITERKKAEKELQQRLEFQENAVRISSRFASTDDFDTAMNQTLADIGKLSKADRSYIFLIRPGNDIVDNTHEWCAAGIEPQIESLQNLSLDLLPWWMNKLKNNEFILVEDIQSLPDEASSERQILEFQDIKSVLVIPLNIGKDLAGFIGFDYVSKPMDTTDIHIAILRITAEICGHALERKQFRQSLLHERDLLQALMDNIPDTIYFKDAESRFTRINKAQAKVLGITSVEEAIGKSDLDYFNTEHAQNAFEAEQRLFKEGIPVINQIEHFETNDKWIWMSATKVPIKDQNGNITGLVGVSHDMTKQKEIEETLRSREQFLRHLNEITSFALKARNVPDLFQLLADHVHKLLSADICFITLWDDKNQQTIPMAASGVLNFDYRKSVDKPGEITMTESVLKEGKPLVAEDVFNTPYLSRRIAEQYPTKSMLGLPLIVDEQKLGAVLIGFLNSYEFTQEEIEYGTIAANQIALVVGKTKILDQLMLNEKDLIRLNAEKDKLFSVIAHDLRSPFTSLLGITDLMAEESADFTMEEMQELAQSVQKSAKGLYKLLENLLEWSRLQGESVRLRPESLNLHEITAHSIDAIKGNIIRKEIIAINEVPEDMIIMADHKMMRSLLGNLLSNAVKFTPRGGKVKASAFRDEEGNIQIEIEDTGIGMTEETLNKLFRIDVKIARPGTEGEPSSGLGLILCKEFVEKHGGSIHVESELEKGSKFVIQIPEAL